MRHTALAALLLVATPLIAQPAPPPMLHGDTSKPVAAGSYQVDPYHTQVAFAVSHMGISPYAGWFAGASGTLTIDPARPTAATVEVTIPVASVTTTSTKLDEELKSADWLDATRFRDAVFKSTGVTVFGPDAAQIAGTLTLHGVTRPVVIHAKLFGTGDNAMSKKPSVGFLARMLIKRSDFGVTKYIPLVSDEVELVINAAFEKDAPAIPARK